MSILLYNQVTQRFAFLSHNCTVLGSLLTGVFGGDETGDSLVAAATNPCHINWRPWGLTSFDPSHAMMNWRRLLILSAVLFVSSALLFDRAFGQTGADFSLSYRKLPAALQRFYAAETEHRVLSIDDAAKRPVLKKFIASIEQSSDEAVIHTVEGPILATSSATLTALFPGWKFYVVPFEMKKNPDYQGNVSIASGLYSVLGVGKVGKRAEFFGYGNYDEFGQFLADNRIRIRAARDAERITTAYYHIYRRGRPKIKPRKSGPNAWHLSPHVVRDREYYYDIATAEDGTVVSGILRSRTATDTPKKD